MSESRVTPSPKPKRAKAAPKRPATRPKPVGKRTGPDASSTPAPERSAPESQLGAFLGTLGGLTSDLTSSAFKLANLTRETASKAISRSPEQLRMMATAGESLRDIREVAGLTASEMVTALNLKDKSVLEAIEDGREVLSIEVILRLASLVARNDPLPFVLKYTRIYYPRLWEILHELKLDQVPLQFERERQFINIYRRHDAARGLADADFDKVFRFTEQAFDMAMSFVADELKPATRPTSSKSKRPARKAPKRPARKRSE